MTYKFKYIRKGYTSKAYRQAMRDALKLALAPRDAIIHFIFSDPRNPFTLEEIGNIPGVGLTRQRVQQIVKRESSK
jgi:DNA-directed RNA polymerase sigma subunit (sigma70/sigma32)